MSDTPPTSAALDAQDINDMLNEMRDLYHDAFGKYPTEAQEEKFLREHPGALDLYRAVKATAPDA